MPPVAMLTFSSAEVPAFKVPFNPTELSFQKQMKYAEIAIPGLDAPLQQFVRGEAEKLTLELFFDSTDKGTGLGATSVTALTDKVFSLARINPRPHAPPIVTVGWSSHFPGDSLLAPFDGAEAQQLRRRDRVDHPEVHAVLAGGHPATRDGELDDSRVPQAR